MEMKYSISEVANFTGLTIRTLRYYDEIGLVPATRLSNEHRIYTLKDLLKLESIIALKNVDFSLNEIKSIINNDEDITRLLALQEQALIEQREMIELKIDRINHLKKLKKSDEIEAAILEQMVKIENKNIIENIQHIINTDEIDFNDHFNKIFLMRNDNKASKLLMVKFIEYLNQVYEGYFNKKTILELSKKYLESDAQNYFNKYEDGFNIYLSKLLIEIAEENYD